MHHASLVDYTSHGAVPLTQNQTLRIRLWLLRMIGRVCNVPLEQKRRDFGSRAPGFLGRAFGVVAPHE